MTAGYGGLGLDSGVSGGARVLSGAIYPRFTAGSNGRAACLIAIPAVSQGFEL